MNYTKAYFDKCYNRKNTRSMKWDGCNEKFGVDSKIEMIPMWIADMDFPSPQEVIDCLHERVDCGSYGYTTKPESFYNAIIHWVKKRYDWEIKKEWIIFTPGVIPGFTVTIQNFTAPGDGIIVQSPVYYPFMDGVINNGRKLVLNPLIEKDGDWTMDFDDLEQKVKDPNNRLLILCNPHNPVGRAWRKDELEKLGEMCADHNVLVISDEIHADLIMPGHTHQPLSKISSKIQNNTMTHYAPSKTFNLAGLQTAFVIIPNNAMRSRYQSGLDSNRIFNMNWFGSTALETAYNQCESYVDALCTYVSENMDYMASFIEKELPMLKMKKAEATYMVWVDFRGTQWKTVQIEEFIAQKAHIGVDMGSWFGEGGAGYLRFNLACPREILVRAMSQLKQAFEEI